MATRREVLNQKVKLLEDSPAKLLEGIPKIEKSLLRAIRKFLGSFTSSDGILVDDGSNLNLITTIEKTILDTITNSKLSDSVSVFLQDFEKLENLNTEYYGRAAALNADEVSALVKKSFRADQKRFADEVIRGLTNREVLRANISNPIRDILYDSIVLNRSFNETSDLLRGSIISKEGADSRLLKYTKQLSRDSIQGFDGARQDKIAREFDLDGVQYLGSNKLTSRPFCCAFLMGRSTQLKNPRHQTLCENMKAQFEAYHLGNGIYKRSDLQAIIDIAKGTPGFRDDTTPENFGQLRGGWNCDDSVVFVRLTDKQRETPTG